MNRTIQMTADEIRATLRGVKTAHIIPANGVYLSDVGLTFRKGGSDMLPAYKMSNQIVCDFVTGGMRPGDIVAACESVKFGTDGVSYFSGGDASKKVGRVRSAATMPRVALRTLLEVKSVFITYQSKIGGEINAMTGYGMAGDRSELDHFLDMHLEPMRKRGAREFANELENDIISGLVLVVVEFAVHHPDISVLPKSDQVKFKVA